MRDYLLVYVVAALLAVSSGCAMCVNHEDCTYPAYGGRWQRSDPCCGRVGSLFDPADAQIIESEVLPEQEALQKGEVDDGMDQVEGKQDSVLAPKIVQ